MKVINGTNEQAEILMQRKARESEKLKLMSWILADMQVSELMETNPKDYITELKQLIDSIYNEFKV
jgi:hypothetical protein